jgi:hypothetical protein
MRMRWAQICQTLMQDQSILLVPTGAFLNWYEPTFLVMTQVEARKQEREADLLSAQIAGADAVARSFLSIEARAHLADNEAIETIFLNYPIEKTPPADLYNRVSDSLAGPIEDKHKMKAALEQCLKTEASPFDTHPATKERITLSEKVKEALQLPFDEQADKLEELFQLSSPAANPAAPAIFGKQLQKAINLVNREWQIGAEIFWEQRYLMHLRANETLIRMEKKKLEESLTLNERHEEAKSIRILKGLTASLPLYRDIRRDFPEDADTLYWIGFITLHKNNDASELDALERAARESENFGTDACLLLISHYRGKDDLSKAKEFEDLIEKHSQSNIEKNNERSALSETDRFKAARVSSEELESIIRQLKKVKDLKSAYLVEKQLTINPEDRCFVIFLRFKIDFDSVMADDETKESYQNSLYTINFNVPDANCLYSIIGSPKSPYLKKVQAIENSKIIG